LRRTSHFLFSAAVGFAVLLSAPAYAQEPVLEPPRLEKSAPAVDPRTGEAPRVDVELDVDRDGKVTDARVIRSGGDALDAAALESARGFGFVPAMRDGAPIAARIRYESVFEARQAEPAPKPEAPAEPAGVVPPSGDPAPAVEKAKPVAETELLRRTFAIDRVCDACGGPLRLIALIKTEATIKKILTAMGLPAEPPVRPARAPRRPPDVAPSSTRPRPRPRQKQSERLRAPVCPECPSPRSAPWPDPSLPS